jgi:thermitase
MHIQEAIESVGQGSPVTVAVISTGVDTDHPDLQGKLLPPVNLTQDTSASHDPLGQGTFLVAIRSAKKVGEKR